MDRIAAATWRPHRGGAAMTTLAEETRAYGRAQLVLAMDQAYRACTTSDTSDNNIARSAAAIDQAVLEAFPDVTIEELAAVWRELARRYAQEAEELGTLARHAPEA
jgi:hypothetical protein